jgi:hypothetical protein
VAPDRQVALQHKLNIGAIVSDASVMVQYGPAPRGAKLGTVEESFVARMKAGDKFWFAGRRSNLSACAIRRPSSAPQCSWCANLPERKDLVKPGAGSSASLAWSALLR